jgi:hypothetical protein
MRVPACSAMRIEVKFAAFTDRIVNEMGSGLSANVRSGDP